MSSESVTIIFANEEWLSHLKPSSSHLLEVHGQAVWRLASASIVSKDSHSCVSAQIFLEVGGATFTAIRWCFKGLTSTSPVSIQNEEQGGQTRELFSVPPFYEGRKFSQEVFLYH